MYLWIVANVSAGWPGPWKEHDWRTGERDMCRCGKNVKIGKLSEDTCAPHKCSPKGDFS